MVDNSWRSSWGGLGLVAPVDHHKISPEPDVPIVVLVVGQPNCIGKPFVCLGIAELVVRVDHFCNLVGEVTSVQPVPCIVVLANVCKECCHDNGRMDPVSPCNIQNDVLLVTLQCRVGLVNDLLPMVDFDVGWVVGGG